MPAAFRIIALVAVAAAHCDAAQDCHSKVAHIPDAWCQQRNCAMVAAFPTFCATSGAAPEATTRAAATTVTIRGRTTTVPLVTATTNAPASTTGETTAAAASTANENAGACVDTQQNPPCQSNWCSSAHWASVCQKTCGKCAADVPTTTAAAATNAPATTAAAATDAPATTAAAATDAPATTAAAATDAPATAAAAATDAPATTAAAATAITPCAGMAAGQAVKETSPGVYAANKAHLDAQEAALTSSKQFANARAAILTRSNDVVEAVAPNLASNPDNVRRIERVVPSGKWDALFPKRNAAYTYTNFLKAAAKFAGLCMTYTDAARASQSDAICAKSLATMFAHFSQETGMHSKVEAAAGTPEFRQGLYFLEEMGCSTATGNGCGYNGECSATNGFTEKWPCGKKADGSWQKYFGRGAKQLSYHYNYGKFSEFIFGDATVLLNDPERVADTWLNLASAVYFFVYPQPPKPSMLHVIDGTWQPTADDAAGLRTPGFGVTTMIINGGIECNTQGAEIAQSVNRVAYYRGMAAALNVPVADGERLTCAMMTPFQQSPSSTFKLNWEQDWSFNSANPGGKSFACKLVGYGTPFSTLAAGDYAKCVQKHFSTTSLCGAGAAQ